MPRQKHVGTSSKRTLLLTGLRCMTSALAFGTSRQIMSKGFHYPYHLLLVHALVILVSQTAARLLDAFKRDEHTIQNQSHVCVEHSGMPRLLVTLIPYLRMACVVGTFLCVYQATFHFIALPVLVMLLVLDWSLVFTDTNWLSVRSLVLACVSICGMAIMFVFDRKLSKGGIIGSVVAVLLISLARSMDDWMAKLCGERHSTCYVRLQSPFTIPALVTVVSTALVRTHEHPIYMPAGPVSLGAILAFNIVCVIAAWRCNLDYFTYTEPSDDDLDSEYIGGKELRHLVTPVVIVGLVTAFCSFLLILPTVSTWQHVGFLISLSAIYISSHLPRSSSLGDAEKTYELLAEAESRDAPTEKPRSQRIPVALSITLVAAIFCFLAPMYWSNPASKNHRSTVEQLATALPREGEAYSLDFVVSRYDESATSLAGYLTPLLELEATSNQSTRVVVYNTGDEHLDTTFRDDLQHALRSQPQVTVQHRRNVGREGAAFLHHIISQWDDLADHTLFMQARPHQPSHMRRLLRNYFVPQTGFLSLSALQDTCSSCENCWDHDTWSESSAILEDIYSRANQGAKCQGFVLTWRGQFVASRRRIQSPGKQLFEDLQDGLTNPKSDQHSQKYVSQPWLPDKVDSLNSPLFGYTLERVWGVLMRCSEQRMALTCPSGLSIAMKILKVAAPGLQDCQCLDEYE